MKLSPSFWITLYKIQLANIYWQCQQHGIGTCVRFTRHSVTSQNTPNYGELFSLTFSFRIVAVTPNCLWFLGMPVVRFCSKKETVMKPERWMVKTGGGALLSRKQIPLRLAWAFSIHKSQVGRLLELNFSHWWSYTVPSSGLLWVG